LPFGRAHFLNGSEERLAVEKIGSFFSNEEEVGMKKVLGIVAAALIVGAPALAQNASTMTYHLQLNGTPSTLVAGATQLYGTAGLVEAGPFPMPLGQDVLNWSARVEVGGTIDLGNGAGAVTPGGAANVVFDLALLKDDVAVNGGTLDTDGGFGIGTPGGEAGFFSTIMWNPAGGASGQEPAAFPWVFSTYEDPDEDGEDSPAPPWGRLIDLVSDNGPNMAQFTYPSTFKFYRATSDGTPVAVPNTTTVTATSGTLMGMGAGYKDFDATVPERGGIGLTGTFNNPVSECYGVAAWQIDSTLPLVEGQINMKGMDAGTYTLVLSAGAGNNVLLPNISCNPFGGGATGAFAAGVPTANVTGSTITFVYNPPVTNPPVMQSADFVMTHTGVGAFSIPLTIAAGSSVAVEPRGGPSLPGTADPRFVLTFDTALDAATIPTVVLSAGTLGAIQVGVPAANQVTVHVSAIPDKTCLDATITGVKSPGSTGTAARHIKVAMLYGDVNSATGGVGSSVNSTDVSDVKQRSGVAATATTFKYDINCSGAINSTDVSDVKQRSGASTIAGCSN
jgi:hypothetical protein